VIQGEGYTLYQGDCLNVLPTFRDRQFDLALTDPPYGIGESAARVASRVNLATPIDYGAFSWDSEPASPVAIEHIRRISQKQIIFGGNYFDLPPSKCWLVWDKLNSGDFADCELAWTNLDKAVRIFRHMWNGMLRASERDCRRVHPTQKPVALMRWCIEQAGHPQTIIDPYMGSGSVGIATIQSGIHFVGIEKDARYFAIAHKRIADAARAVAGLPKQLSGRVEDYSESPLFAGVTP